MKNHPPLFLIAVITGAIILGIMVFNVRFPHSGMASSAVARGGEVTNINLNSLGTRWSGCFGLLGINATNRTFVVNGSEFEVTKCNINLTSCFVTELYATNESFPESSATPFSASAEFMGNLVAGNTSDLDSLLGLSANDTLSGTKVFSETSAFEVGSSTLTVPTFTINSVSGSYNVGLLRDSDAGNFVYVMTITDGLAYNGSRAHFQTMIPAPLEDIYNYTFFYDGADNIACGFEEEEAAAPVEEKPAAVRTGGCTPLWVCTEWEECLPEGIRKRACTDLSECRNARVPPQEVPCVYRPSCFDNLQNQGEEGVDCGGPCHTCYAEPEIEKPKPAFFTPAKTEARRLPMTLFAIIGIVILLLVSAYILKRLED